MFRKSAGTLAPLLIGDLLFVLLGIWENYASLAYPLFPKAVMGNIRGVTVMFGSIFLIGTLFYSSAVLWPQQVERLYSSNPITIGWYSCAIGIAAMVFSPFQGLVMRATKQTQYLFTFVAFAAAVACGAQTIVSKSILS
jgi:hypothetical protein